jgi:RNA polymerase sigma-70 factor (ECF subfamily)
MPLETELLAAFGNAHSEDALRGIVEIHGGMVLATALRQVGDRGLAEEITQDVFVLLVKKAPALRREATIGGWLYKTTLNRSRARLRSELRRRRREVLSAEMSALTQEGESIWRSLGPLLDEAVTGLPESDQVAIVLRFMEDRSFREVGRVLGVGEDAARKRIDRVVHSLSEWFRRRGLIVSASSLTALMAVNVKAAPTAPALAASIAQGALSATAGVTGASLLSTIVMTSTQFKITAGALVLLLVLAGSAPVLLKRGKQARSSEPIGRSLSNTTTVASGNGSLPQQAVAAAIVPPAKSALNFFTRLQQGDESLTLLPNDQAQAFLQANHTNAESLLAAYQVTRDKEYLRQAAEKFTNDPSVLIRAIAFDVAPEKKRQMLEQLKKVDPDNAIAPYLSASDHFKNNEIEAAFKDLTEANGRKSFHDYTTEQSQTMEEIYLAAGHSAAEAKALGVSSLELPHLRQVVDVARGLQSLMDQYSQAGDSSSAAALAQSGLSLAARLEAADQGGALRIGEFLGWKMQQGFLNKLDPAQQYSFLDGDVARNLSIAADREKSMQADNGIVSDWLAQAPENEIIAYYDRIKVYGESAALQWLKARFPGN